MVGRQVALDMVEFMLELMLAVTSTSLLNSLMFMPLPPSQSNMEVSFLLGS